MLTHFPTSAHMGTPAAATSKAYDAVDGSLVIDILIEDDVPASRFDDARPLTQATSLGPLAAAAVVQGQ